MLFYLQADVRKRLQTRNKHEEWATWVQSCNPPWRKGDALFPELSQPSSGRAGQQAIPPTGCFRDEEILSALCKGWRPLGSRDPCRLQWLSLNHCLPWAEFELTGYCWETPHSLLPIPTCSLVPVSGTRYWQPPLSQPSATSVDASDTSVGRRSAKYTRQCPILHGESLISYGRCDDFFPHPIQQLFLYCVYQQVTSNRANFSYKAIATTVTVACTSLAQKQRHEN